MVTIFQVRDFMGGEIRKGPKYLGSFFSVESAEEKLGWFFFHNCCEARPF